LIGVGPVENPDSPLRYGVIQVVRYRDWSSRCFQASVRSRVGPDENFFCKLKEFKRIAMLSDKTDPSFKA
jgi:hypothetical protein